MTGKDGRDGVTVIGKDGVTGSGNFGVTGSGNLGVTGPVDAPPAPAVAISAISLPTARGKEKFLQSIFSVELSFVFSDVLFGYSQEFHLISTRFPRGPSLSIRRTNGGQEYAAYVGVACDAIGRSVAWRAWGQERCVDWSGVEWR